MSYVNVVMPLMDFIPYVSDILVKKNGVLYVEKRSGDDSFSSIKVGQGNYESIVKRNREKNLNFFIASKELEFPGINFYDDATCPWIIEGVGGRETDDAIERIALRLVSKNPENATVKIFNAIKSKLKKDKAIGVGVEGGSPLHEHYFYQKANACKKIFVTDINNDKSPVIKPLL
jgi:hypothetical protein